MLWDAFALSHFDILTTANDYCGRTDIVVGLLRDIAPQRRLLARTHALILAGNSKPSGDAGGDMSSVERLERYLARLLFCHSRI